MENDTVQQLRDGGHYEEYFAWSHGWMVQDIAGCQCRLCALEEVGAFHQD